MSDIQKESEYLNEHIEECRSRIETIQSYIESHKDADLSECRKNIAVLQAAIAALREKQHNDELQQRLYNIFGGDMTLDLVVDELQRQLEEPDKPHPLYAKILTYEDADKWEKWKQLEEQGRLVELPCAIGEYVYRIVKTGASETYTIMHKGHGYSREVPFRGILGCPFNLQLVDEFGKTVFLTYEAAREALEKMEKAAGRS